MQGPLRTSGILAPIMLLTGHAGEVFTVKFSPGGDVVASGSHDRHIFLWRTYGECENFMMIKGASALLVNYYLHAPARMWRHARSCESFCALPSDHAEHAEQGRVVAGMLLWDAGEQCGARGGE